MSSSGSEGKRDGRRENGAARNGKTTATVHRVVACSGELDLSGTSVSPVQDNGASRGGDVRILTVGEGGVRTVRSNTNPDVYARPMQAMLPAVIHNHASPEPVGLPLAGPAHMAMIDTTMPGAHSAKTAGALKELQKIHRLLRGRYLWAIALALVLGTLGILGGYRAGMKAYRSAGVIRVMPVVPKVMYSVPEKDTLPMYETFVDAQISLLKNQRVINQALQEPAWKSLGEKAPPAEVAIHQLTDEVTISRQGELIWVQALSADPQVAIASVDSTIAAYLKIYAQIEAETGLKPREVREQLRDKLTGEWNDLREQIRTLAKANGTDDLKAQFEFKQTERNRLEAAIRDKQMEAAVLSQFKVAPTSAPAIRRPEDIAFRYRDPQMAALLNQRASLKAAIELADKEGRSANESTKKMRTDMAGVQKQIEDYARTFKEFVENNPNIANEQDPRELAVKIESLQALYDKVDEEMKALGAKELRIAELREKAADVKQKLDETTRAIEQLEVESQVMGRVVVMGQAERPLGPYKDTRLSTAAAGGFCGVAAGFGAILLLGLLNAKMDRPDDVDSQMANISFLGMVPGLPEDLSKPEHAALAAHCVHDIRTRLQIISQGQPRVTFGITSATAGAGKTSLTIALGLSFAAANQRTLLIDCDIVGGGLTRKVDAIARRRLGSILVHEGLITQRQMEDGLRAATRLGQPLGRALLGLGYITENALSDAVSLQEDEMMGLLDALEGEEISSCIAETGIDGLSILPLGGATAQDAASLSPEAFRRLIDQAGQMYDVVLIDTGPILGSLEASVVASQTDAVVLAVARGETKAIVGKSIAQLITLGTRIAGMVFNRARDQDVVAYGSHVSSSNSVRSTSGTGVVEQMEVPAAERFGPVARAVASWSPAVGAGSRRSRNRNGQRNGAPPIAH